MKKHGSEIEGASFGLMSGVITILGVLIGLSATGVKSIATLGIIIVGIADAFSDAAGMYVSEESERLHNQKEMLTSALFTFVGKIGVLIILLIPVLLFELKIGMIVSVVVGMLILSSLAYYIGKHFNEKVKLAVKYMIIAAAIAIISYSVGMVAKNFIL